ncbi:MMPL family transporter [Geomicrobium sp. JSM 1781026]|uniref:MMPL family transporter n=1 Tax=Geomicrobium sp. JSM 1781026 TaxID=3344580 RepID=UPI0035C21436
MKNLLEYVSNVMMKWNWVIIGFWIVTLIFGIFYSSELQDRLTGGGWSVPGSDSEEAYHYVTESFETRDASSLTISIHHDDWVVEDDTYRQVLEQTTTALLEEPIVEQVYTWNHLEEGVRESFVAENGHTSIGIVELNIDEGFAQKYVPHIQERLTAIIDEEGFDVALVGTPAFWGEMNELSQEGLENAHLYALPIILMILIVVFRSAVSAMIPLFLSSISIVGTLTVLTFISLNMEMSVFVLDAALMLGIGVGIDFTLIFLKRFQEELQTSGENLHEAINQTMRDSGSSIVYSGLTIIGTMAALLFVEIAAVRSIAIGIIVVVTLLLLVGLTLLPALLSLLGKRVFALAIFPSKRTKRKSFSIVRQVMKRPVVYLISATIVLLVLSIPALDLKVATPDAQLLPENSDVRKGIVNIDHSFGEGYTSPIHVVMEVPKETVRSSENLEYIKQTEQWLSNVEHVESVQSIFSLFSVDDNEVLIQTLEETSELLTSDQQLMLDRYLSVDQTVVVFDVISKYSASSKETREIVDGIREEFVSQSSEWNVYVGGETAEGMDTSASLNDRLVPVLCLTLAFLFIILTVTFQSLVIPIKAIAMNLLSLGATYGILVMVFQWGWGSNLFGIEDFSYIQNFVPILLLGLLFSLSTDYEVFLLSRVQEAYHSGKSNRDSVEIGIMKSAPIISGAAVIMIAVFGSFAFAGVLPMQQLGLGMAVAILIDATLIRLLIVPATMTWLGKWNWWFPFKRR